MCCRKEGIGQRPGAQKANVGSPHQGQLVIHRRRRSQGRDAATKLVPALPSSEERQVPICRVSQRLPAATQRVEGLVVLSAGQQPGGLQIHLQFYPKRNRLQPGHCSKVAPQRRGRGVESAHLVASIVQARKVSSRRRQPGGKVRALGLADPLDLRVHLGPQLQLLAQ